MSDSSEQSGVEETKPRCDFAVNAFKEAIGSIDGQIEKIKGLSNMEGEEEEEVEMPEAGKTVEIQEAGKEVEKES